MKNKKLFAILTLVCFMFTLMPVAAFAEPAVTDYVGVYGSAGKDTVSVKVGDKVKVSVFNKDKVAQTTASYYFWAETAEEEVVALGEGFEFEFEDVDTFYVYAVESIGENDNVDKVFADPVATPGQIVETIKARYAKFIIDDALEVKVKKADTVYELKGPASITGVKANDNWTEVKATVSLTKNGNPAKNADIEFTADSSYVTIEKVDRTTTDRNGEQVIRVTAAKAGNYVIYADYEDAKTLEIAVAVTGDDVSTITTVAEPARGVALNSSFGGRGLSDIVFEIFTADGTLVDADYVKDAGKAKLYDLAPYRITVVDAPADADIDEEALELVWNVDVENWVLFSNTEALNEEGTYTFKVALKDGNAATATVKVVEFDKPIMMNVIMKDNTVALVDGVATAVKSVVFIDKNGTVLSAAHKDYTKYAGDRIMAGEDLNGNGTLLDDIKGYKGLDFAGSGKALKNVDPVSGEVSTVAYNSETKALVGTTVTITAVNDKLEMTASANLTVVNKAEGLKYVSTTADIAVNNELIVNTVDEDGNIVAAGLETKKATPSVYVLSAPANAAYSATAKVTDEDEVTVTFTASAAGEYKLQTIVRVAGVYYSSVDTIVVGGTTGQFEDVVVMSIGAKTIIVNNEVKEMLAAPVIKDGRTFVPFRAGLEALGATVEYDQATQSVVAELNGVKVVMTIGEKVYTVNGVAKTADVAPYLNVEASTTMVPVRFVAEAFGITVTPLYAEDGTVADVLFAN